MKQKIIIILTILIIATIVLFKTGLLPASTVSIGYDEQDICTSAIVYYSQFCTIDSGWNCVYIDGAGFVIHGSDCPGGAFTSDPLLATENAPMHFNADLFNSCTGLFSPSGYIGGTCTSNPAGTGGSTTTTTTTTMTISEDNNQNQQNNNEETSIDRLSALFQGIIDFIKTIISSILGVFT